MEAEESVTDARAAGTHTSRMASHGFQQTFTRIGVRYTIMEKAPPRIGPTPG